MSDLSTPLRWGLLITLGMLSLALLIAFVRLLRGPSAPDRVVALDLIAVVVVGMISVFTALTGEAQFLRAAMAFALISFLGTVAVARYLERSMRR